ncbi:MAG: hypothetical protein ACREEM_13810 [Blastocatellia bacterium]
MNYSLSDDLTREQFEELRLSGEVNPNATFEDYLLLRREREEIRREAEAAARCDGFELGAPELELTPEDEAILDRAWAAVAANKLVGEQEPAPSAHAA